MGSYAQLRVGDLEVAHFKSEIESWIALIFTAGDWRSRPASQDELDNYDQDKPWEVRELVASVAVVRDRLEVTGVDWAAVVAAFDRIVAEKMVWYRELVERLSLSEGSTDDGIVARIRRESEYLSGLCLNDWVVALVGAPPDASWQSALDPGNRAWLIRLWDDVDVRLCLRAVLECRRDDALVVIDATDLIEGGWMEPDDDPRAVALLQFGWAQTYASPIVVLTEGSTDAHILETALAVLYPHLRGFISFPDFAQRPEANAGALVRTVKAFAAAGITNRVVALFDADAAARDAVRSLAIGNLPQSIRVLHLPPIELARSYPTIGPDGRASTDINGHACSIELYLGRDVLIDSTGDLRPVRWGSYLGAVSAYQGVIEGKSAIHDAFWKKADAVSRDPSIVAQQDWADLRAVIDCVRFAFVDT